MKKEDRPKEISHLTLSHQDLRELRQRVEQREVVTAPLLVAVLVAVVAQFLNGYNTGVMNAPAAVVFPDHSIAEWSMAVSAFAVGGPFGALLGGWSANKHGRAGALVRCAWIFLVGGLLMALAADVSRCSRCSFVVVLVVDDLLDAFFVEIIFLAHRM